MSRSALVFLGSVALLSTSPPLPAAPAQSSAQSSTAPFRFQAMDRNGDRVITRDEWQGSAQSFRVHDWNGDGRLSGAEIRIGAQRDSNWEEQDHAPSSVERYLSWTVIGFRNLDHNRDNRVTQNEWHFDSETFRRVDRNGDAALSQAEFLGGDDWDDDRGDNFDDLDVNNNGVLERNEWHGGANVFEALDRNRNGVLSRFEVVGNGTSTNVWNEFRSLDFNANGSISVDEWHWSRNSFGVRDTNGDGRLSPQEFAAFSGSPDAGRSAGAGTAPRRAATARVNPKERWTDSTLDVLAGETLAFAVTGTITLNNGADVADPGGARSGYKAPDSPFHDQRAGALIARVGDVPVYVGSSTTIVAPATGRLYLGVNDDLLSDNTGEFVVNVTRRAR